MFVRSRVIVIAIAAVFFSVPAFAAANNPPPAGAILDLGGGETGTAAQAIDHDVPVTETVSFAAIVANTNVTFAFRDDPNFILFSNVSVMNVTTGSSTNLITNGDFTGGQYPDPTNDTGLTPDGWTYANIYGASVSGYVRTSTCPFFGTCWYDGSVQAYDALTQVISTVVGDIYAISFQYSESSGQTNFSDVSTNGDSTDSDGNGVDILVYAQEGLPAVCPQGQICSGSTSAPTAVAEPKSLLLLATALLVVPFVRRRAAVKPA